MICTVRSTRGPQVYQVHTLSLGKEAVARRVRSLYQIVRRCSGGVAQSGERAGMVAVVSSAGCGMHLAEALEVRDRVGVTVVVEVEFQQHCKAISR